MIIDWQGKKYALDFADLDLHQAEVIEKETGEPIDKWLDALGAGTRKLQFIHLLYWLMLAQNGEEVPVAAVNFKLIPFTRAFSAAMAAEPAPDPVQEAVGPTKPSPDPASPSPPAPPSQEPAPGEEVGEPATVS